MKKFVFISTLFSSLALPIMAFVFPSPVWAQKSIGRMQAVMDLRVNSGEARRYCQNQSGSCEVVEIDSKEFASGNTFVRFTSNVAGLDVKLLLPIENLTADSMMEALIKVYTAKQLGARSVEVTGLHSHISVEGLKSNAGQSDYQSSLSAGIVAESELGRADLEFARADLDIELRGLFQQAGATKYNGERLVSKSLKPTQSLRQNFLISGEQHPELASQLGKALGIAQLSATGTRLESVESSRSKFLNDALQLDSNSSQLNPNSIRPPVVGQPANLQTTQVFYIVSSAAPSNLNLLKAYVEIRRLRKSGARVDVVAPYMLYARSEKPENGVVAVTNLVAKMLESAGASSVTVVRPHAIASLTSFSIPTIEVSGRQTINARLKELNVDVVVAPDAGAQKDDTLYADALELPIAVINKQRDPVTGKSKIVGMSGPDVRGKAVVIIDDETASGSTLCESAEYLSVRLGAARVIAVVTHLAGKAAAALNCEFIEELVVTNTINIPEEVMTGARADLSAGGVVADVQPEQARRPRVRALSIADELADNLLLRQPSLRMRELIKARNSSLIPEPSSEFKSKAGSESLGVVRCESL